jgi:hypothetical protein
MADERPLDLRALADVDEPEVVRDALRRFRRRVLTRYVWVVAAVVVAGSAVVWGRTPTTLQQRVDAARNVVYVDRVWRVDGVTVGLDRVADLGDTVGLHFVVIPGPEMRAGNAHIEVTGQVAGMGFREWDRYVEIRRMPAGRVPTLTIVVNGRSDRIPLGPRNAGVPPDIWR